MMRKRAAVTIYDIAKAAGVSYATVSRVMNNKSDVSPKTAEKVRSVMRELGYTPNRIARALPKQKFNAIGALLPTARYFANDPYLVEVFHGMVESASARGFNICLILQKQLEHEFPNVFVDGFVVVGESVDARRQKALFEYGAPIAVVNRTWSGENVLSVRGDTRGGIIQAVAHLRSLGHRRLGALLCDDQNGEEKLRSIFEAARSSDVSVIHRKVEMADRLGLEVVVSEMVAEGITGLLCHSDLMATGVLDWCRRQNIRVPEELSVVGFDDTELARSSTPPLTTVRLPVREMGRSAIEMLYKKLEGLEAVSDVVFECSLVVRESTGPPPR